MGIFSITFSETFANKVVSAWASAKAVSRLEKAFEKLVF